MRFIVEGLDGYMWFTVEGDKSKLNLCIPISQIRIKLGKDKQNQRPKVNKNQLSTIRETSEPREEPREEKDGKDEER